MGMVSEKSLRSALARHSQTPAWRAWPELSARYPDVLEFLLQHKGALGRMDDQAAKLVLIVTDAPVDSHTRRGPTYLTLCRWEDVLLQDPTRPWSSNVLRHLRWSEPELGALLAFFLKSLEQSASGEEADACSLAVGAAALAAVQGWPYGELEAASARRTRRSADAGPRREPRVGTVYRPARTVAAP